MSILKKIYRASLLFLFSLPISVLAQSRPRDFRSLVGGYFLPILNSLVALIIGLAMISFLWGVFGYFRTIGDEKSRETAKDYMVYGIIGIFVMTSVWGLVKVLVRTFGF